MKTSGEMMEYDTGAHRDSEKGKPRIDLIPNSFFELLLSSKLSQDSLVLLYQIRDSFSNRQKDLQAFLDDVMSVITHMYGSPHEALLDLGNRLAEGAEKYGANNWEKGFPHDRVFRSFERHYVMYGAGMTDEDHKGAVLFNLMVLVHYHHV